MAEKILMKGNEALAEGAVRAGCRFFAGYPITPQNEVPEYMSWRLPEVNGTFIQAESEIAAINMLYGAAACGARTMTSSSGPGISLKQEGISYCAGALIPIFYANVVRGGPGLGNIAPAQGDYFQATRGGGHGDYRVFCMAPASVSELANFPRICYDKAFKYRIPSMILADGLLGQMMEPVEFDFDPVDPSKIPEHEWVLGINENREKRVVKSYDLRPGKMEEFNFKLETILNEVEKNEVLFESVNTDDAELILTGYGTAARVCKSAMMLARKAGMKVGLIRPITLWPFPSKEFYKLADRVKKFFVLEMSLGQYVEDVRMSVQGKAEVHLHKRPAGGIPTTEEVFELVKKLTGNS